MMVSNRIRMQAAEAAQAERTGQARQWSVIVPPLPPGNGLTPVDPSLLLQRVGELAPTPAELARQVEAATRGALALVRGAAPLVAGFGSLTAALAPAIGAAGGAVAPVLGAIPYVGPALAGVAGVAGPVAGVGGTIAAAGGAIVGAAAGAPVPPNLMDVGANVVRQLDALAQGAPASQASAPAPGAAAGG